MTTLRPRTAALAGIALGTLAFAVLLAGGYGVERAACPDPKSALVTTVAIVTLFAATAGLGLSMWAYRATAGEPSGDWLLGAAALYFSALAWAATAGAAAALLVIDLCTL